MSRLATLAHEADSVILGTCESVVSTWDEEAHVIVTRATVRASRRFKGTPDDTVVVQTLGGTVGELTMVASHSVTLNQGEPAVLFLRRSRFGSYWVVWGGDEGRLAVHTASNGTTMVGAGAAMDLDDFAARIDAAGSR